MKVKLGILILLLFVTTSCLPQPDHSVITYAGVVTALSHEGEDAFMPMARTTVFFADGTKVMVKGIIELEVGKKWAITVTRVDSPRGARIISVGEIK